jgi:hypothetical protein
MRRRSTWVIRVCTAGGLALLLAAVVALATTSPAAPCPPSGPCDAPAANHPHQRLAAELAVAGGLLIAAGVAAAARSGAL